MVHTSEIRRPTIRWSWRWAPLPGAVAIALVGSGLWLLEAPRSSGRITTVAAALGLLVCLYGAIDWYVLHITRRARLQFDRLTRSFERSEAQLAHAVGEIETLHARLMTSGLREPVTGLPNRRACLEAIDRALARQRKDTGRHVAVLSLGFERLQRVADVHGHPLADRLLLEAAGRVEQLLEPHDFLSRIGDTQLALIVPDVRDAKAAAHLAGLIAEVLRPPCDLEGRRFHLDQKIGVASSASGLDNADQILTHAILAMHQASQSDARTIQIYQPRSANELATRLQLESDLRQALERNQFVLWYQPIFDNSATAIAGVEALLRWNHPREGLLLPERFLSVARDMGLMSDITHWLLREVVKQAAQWQRSGDRRFFISANLTAESFGDSNLVAEISELLLEFRVPARRIKLEIVETTVVADVSGVSRLINTLKELGIEVWLDDFGTGYSSLSYLRALAFQGVKLDRAFVAHMAADTRDFGLVKSIIDLLHYLEMLCVAEGVETSEQRDLLRIAGCDLYQGFLFARPMPAASAEQRLGTDRTPAGHAKAG
jgi:diguanylate cyclase (GGDEF)-like protein